MEDEKCKKLECCMECEEYIYCRHKCKYNCFTCEKTGITKDFMIFRNDNNVKL